MLFNLKTPESLCSCASKKSIKKNVCFLVNVSVG